MGIFRRRKSSDEPVEPVEATGVDAEVETAADDVEDVAHDAAHEVADDGGGGDSVDESEAEVVPVDDPPFSRARGPFDVAEEQAAREDELLAPAEARIDLGAVSLTPVDGMQLRLELDEGQERVVSAQASLGDSSVQIQVFAAPRSYGIWQEIRDEIAQSVAQQGGTADVVDGELGRELVCRIAGQAPDGRTAFSQVRFAGVDGPRWFLRAVFSGRAALDRGAAAPFVALVRSVVVTRGDAAMPPREVIDLTIPAQLAGPPPTDDGQASGAGSGEGADEAPRLDDLKPFDRGPEITEVR